MARIQRDGAADLRSVAGPELRVHLGCGDDVRVGWVNIDHWPWSDPPAVAGGTVVNYDLRAGLPLQAGSCEAIYASHFFEHLDAADGERLLRESLAALRSGGVLRLAVPDFRRCAEAYVSGDTDYFAAVEAEGLVRPRWPGLAGLMDCMNYVMYQAGEHRCMYDLECLSRLLGDLGAASVEASGFDPRFDVDSPVRRGYSLYVQATA
jgi:predicted SAM-dependent methyltransferase